jgi:hypothetical protein
MVIEKKFTARVYEKPKQSPILQEEYPELYNEDGSVNLESETAKEFLEDYKDPEGFGKIGYQRSLGGFFYQFFFAIIGAAFIGITYPIILRELYPFPESKSMASIAGILFMFIQNLFNVPTGYAIERFIGEWRIKDTRKMVQYIRFYVWYQMLTGILLVTSFSVFVLHMLQSDNGLVWAKWLMLVTISREFPANTGVFLSTLKGLQQFNYESVLNFLNDTFIRPLFEIVFVLWGKYVLGANPRFGPMLGIAIGYAIGTYVDDFVSMALAMGYLNKAMKPMGYNLIDCLIPQVDRDVMISSIKFGFTVAIPGLIGSVWGTITTLWWYEMVPAYLTFIALSKLADEIANLIKRGGGINIKATISEAYNNGKLNLTSYYISLSWKFIFFFMFAIGSVVIAFMPILVESLFGAVGAEEYVLAAAFIVPNILATTIEEPNGTASNIILGANKPMFLTILDIIFQVISVGLTYMFLFVWRVQDGGIDAMIWLLPLGGFAPALVQMIIKWVYIDKRICPVEVKNFAWQTWVAPLVPAVIIFIVAQLWKVLIFPPMVVLFGANDMAVIIAGTITILFMFVVCLMFLFFPLYTAFGGWDDNTLNIFHEAVEISGPSKFLFRPIDKASQWLGKKSPLHNRFKIPHEKALEEAAELMKERFIKDKLVTILASRD